MRFPGRSIAPLCLTAASLLACADEAPAVHAASVHLSFQSPVPCANPNYLDDMQADLFVAGHDACPLSVQDDLSADGVCGPISVRIERPLMVHYHVARNGQTMSLAFAIGIVDLRSGAVPEVDDPDEAPVVEVTLEADSLLYRPVDFDGIAIPNDDCQQANNDIPEQWAKCEALERGFSLGCGTTDPTTPNLIRACANNFGDCI